jgi:hypothetical protein
MPLVTSENKADFDKKELSKKELNRPRASNVFYHRYKDKVLPHKEYFEFVKQNEPHVKEYSSSIKDEVKRLTGLNEKQQAKKLHERMKEAVNHVTETWDYTKP